MPVAEKRPDLSSSIFLANLLVSDSSPGPNIASLGVFLGQRDRSMDDKWWKAIFPCFTKWFISGEHRRYLGNKEIFRIIRHYEVAGTLLFYCIISLFSVDAISYSDLCAIRLWAHGYFSLPCICNQAWKYMGYHDVWYENCSLGILFLIFKLKMVVHQITLEQTLGDALDLSSRACSMYFGQCVIYNKPHTFSYLLS